MLKKIDFSPGKITYDSFDIDPNVSFEQQIGSLREDLFQVSYDEKYIVDIGWFSDFDPQGNFIVQIIKNYDWEKPVYLKKTSDIEQLNEFVKECAKIVRELMASK